MEKYINKVYASLIAILLAIISFFLMGTYNKINATNALVQQLQVDLAGMREKESHFLTYQECSNLIDKKIDLYHHNHR